MVSLALNETRKALLLAAYTMVYGEEALVGDVLDTGALADKIGVDRRQVAKEAQFLASFQLLEIQHELLGETCLCMPTAAGLDVIEQNALTFGLDRTLVKARQHRRRSLLQSLADGGDFADLDSIGDYEERDADLRYLDDKGWVKLHAGGSATSITPAGVHVLEAEQSAETGVRVDLSIAAAALKSAGFGVSVEHVDATEASFAVGHWSPAAAEARKAFEAFFDEAAVRLLSPETKLRGGAARKALEAARHLTTAEAEWVKGTASMLHQGAHAGTIHQSEARLKLAMLALVLEHFTRKWRDRR